MKKILSVLAVLALLFSVVGCANSIAISDFEKPFPSEWLSDWKPSDPNVKLGGTGEAWDILSTEGWTWGGSSGKEFTSGDGHYYETETIYGKDGKYTYNYYEHEKDSATNLNYKRKWTWTGYIYVDNGVITLTIKNVAFAFYNVKERETNIYHASCDVSITQGIMAMKKDENNANSYSMFVRQSDEESGIPGTWIFEYFNFGVNNDGSIWTGKYQQKYELTDDADGKKYTYTQTDAKGKTEVERGEWSVKNADNNTYTGYKGDDYCQSKLLYIWRLNLN